MPPEAAEQLEIEEIEETTEVELDDGEMLGAIDEELAAEPESEVEPDPEPEPPATDGDDEPDGEPEPEAKPDGEPEKEPEPEPEPEPAGEKKPSDEFGTLDKDTPEKTRERFDALKSKYDEIVAERNAVKQESDQWVEAITGTGTNPQQFGMALNWLKKINSGKPEDLEDAYQIMSRELEAIAKTLGKRVPGQHDPLDEHPDLKQKVDEGMMDEESALEVIHARAMRKMSQTAAQTQQAQSQQQQAVQDGLASVKALGARLSASDPQFDAKVKFLTPIIQAAVSSGAAPDKWANMIEQAWANIPPMPMTTTPAVPKPQAPNPIRPGGTSPSSTPMQKEPGNELEALNQALERGY